MVLVSTTTGLFPQMMVLICLKPSKKPETDTRFQLVVGCVMKAVKKHALLLRTAASNPGNDHRLGANEAPASNYFYLLR